MGTNKQHDVDLSFGWCPLCGSADGYLNVYNVQYCYCEAHRAMWRVGEDVFSSWQYEDADVWTRNAEQLRTYREVDAFLPTAHMLHQWMKTECR